MKKAETTPPRPRLHDRRATALPVEWRGPEGNGEGSALNISQGGMFVHTRQPLPDGARVFFRVRPQAHPLHFHVEGEVVWSKKSRRRSRRRNAPMPGMGIRFLASRFQTETLLESMLSAVARTASA